MEARDPNALSVATKLESSFRHKFRDMQHTVHPADIPGEVPGKSSNIGWAAQEVQRKYAGSPDWKDVLLTVMDSKPIDVPVLYLTKLTSTQVIPTSSVIISRSSSTNTSTIDRPAT